MLLPMPLLYTRHHSAGVERVQRPMHHCARPATGDPACHLRWSHTQSPAMCMVADVEHARQFGHSWPIFLLRLSAVSHQCRRPQLASRSRKEASVSTMQSYPAVPAPGSAGRSPVPHMRVPEFAGCSVLASQRPSVQVAFRAVPMFPCSRHHTRCFRKTTTATCR